MWQSLRNILGNLVLLRTFLAKNAVLSIKDWIHNIWMSVQVSDWMQTSGLCLAMFTFMINISHLMSGSYQVTNRKLSLACCKTEFLYAVISLMITVKHIHMAYLPIIRHVLFPLVEGNMRHMSWLMKGGCNKACIGGPQKPDSRYVPTINTTHKRGQTQSVMLP